MWLDTEHKIPYGAAEAAGLWMEILASGEKISTRDLVLLKERLKTSLQVERQSQTYDDKQGAFDILLWKVASGLDRLYVTSPAIDMIDLTPLIEAQLACRQPQMLRIYSPTWVSAATFPEKVIFQLSFALRWSCDGKIRSASGVGILTARPNQDSILQFDAKSIEINVGAP